MRTVIIFILIGFLIFVFSQVYSFWRRIEISKREYQEILSKTQKAQVDYEKLKSEIKYYSNLENLEKEAKKRFNYIKPGEKMIIIVPNKGNGGSAQ